jgi:hypothetical protein
VFEALVAGIKKRNAYKILVGNPEGKKMPLWRSRREGKIKVDLDELGYEVAELINLVHEIQWPAL